MTQSKNKFSDQEKLLIKKSISMARDNVIEPHANERIKRNAFRRELDLLFKNKIKLRNED